jgi:hypothetical protein
MQRRTSHAERVLHLSQSSVRKRFDAYGDIDWEAPELAVDPEDPRWELSAPRTLAGTEWFQRQPAAARARMGLHFRMVQMKMGVEFEAILSQGLLELASSLPNGSPEARYAYHEVIEEAQHSLMFNEMVGRSGLDPRGMPAVHRVLSRRVPRLGRTFPELFFLYVLAGEAPIDYVQRGELARPDRDATHPLLRRLMRIHVTEEARHICFAESYLREHVPRLGAWKRWMLQVHAPMVLAGTARTMLDPSASFVRAYRVPRAVVREAFAHNAEHRQSLVEGTAPVRHLCQELALITPVTAGVWRALGIGPSARPRRQLAAAPPSPPVLAQLAPGYGTLVLPAASTGHAPAPGARGEG